MKSTIYIPQKIKVGYQKRGDTYTKKLAYVIYYDAKNKLRKEASWTTWRNKEIEPTDFDNAPTNGFVLNKKVGDYHYSSWEQRKAHIRIYDPRDFEFEISVENLLYILENTSAIKGKGLDGDFVYGWDQKDLILIPVGSPDYAQISEFSNMISTKETVKVKDLILGATYKTNKNENWIYLGRFDEYHNYSWTKECGQSKGKKFYFWNNDYERISSLGGRIIRLENSECVSNYAEIMDNLQHYSFYSPHNPDVDIYTTLTLDELKVLFAGRDGYNYMVLYTNYGNEKTKINLSWYKDTDRAYIRFDWNWDYNVSYTGKTAYNHYKDITKDNNTISLEELHNIFIFEKKTEYLMNGKEKKG